MDSGVSQGLPRDHEAVKAWNRLVRRSGGPVRIEALKERPRASVYRLIGVGPSGTAVIAKRCGRQTAAVERMLYEELLPRLRAPSLCCHGWVEAENGDCWLFLDDAGSEEECGLREEHAELVGVWLGAMHRAAESWGLEARLPSRGPAHYLARLESAREMIGRSMANPALDEEDRRVLSAVMSRCESVASHWGSLERVCRVLPRTLVHGDFVSKNLRVRAAKAGPALLALDWEEAGWGTPAVDLVELRRGRARSGLAAYWSAAREGRPPLGVRETETIADLGALFWIVAVLSAECQSLDGEGCGKAVRKIRVYEAWMRDAMTSLQMRG